MAAREKSDVLALPRRWPNVMLEIRNDLIADGSAQRRIADQIHALAVIAMSQLQSDTEQRGRP